MNFNEPCEAGQVLINNDTFKQTWISVDNIIQTQSEVVVGGGVMTERGFPFSTAEKKLI